MSSLVGRRDKLDSRCDSGTFSGLSAKEILRTALVGVIVKIYEMLTVKIPTYSEHRLTSADAGTPMRNVCATLRIYADKTDSRMLGSSSLRTDTLCSRAEMIVAGRFGAPTARLCLN